MMRYDGHFRIAQTIGKHLHDVMGWPGPMTHRQYEAWQIWLGEEWNRPSRTDVYLMQIALEVRRVLSSKPGEMKLQDMTIPFKIVKPKTKEQLEKERLLKEEADRTVWLARVMPKKKTEETKEAQKPVKLERNKDKPNKKPKKWNDV